jgi:hypothetical protein
MADESNADNESEPNADDDSKSAVVRFPQSRVGLTARKPFLELGAGPLAQTLGPPAEQATGHWCRYCRGIWYGYLLEVTCPRCGNRHG